MRLARYLRRAFRLLRRKSQIEAELDSELRACTEMLIERYVALGMTPEDARRAASREMGGIAQVKENVREVRMGAFFETLLYDMGHAFRRLRRERAFAALAIVTAALGIGINAAVFSALYAVMLKPLPYNHPERLVTIWAQFQLMGALRAPGSGLQLIELQRRARLFEGIAGIWVGNGTIKGNPEPEQIKLSRVTTNFFDVLGVRPAIGRGFVPGDSAPDGLRAAIISDGLWHRRFGADPHIIGQRLRVGGNGLTILGVMPPGFQMYFAPDSNIPGDVPVFAPFEQGIENAPRDLYYIRFLGRMMPGVTLQAAHADLDSIAAYLRASYIEYSRENLKFSATGFHGDAVREVRPGLASLMAGAVFVLLIACVNVANLLLARGASRRRELALRSAIGASAARVIRQVFAETLALGTVAAVAGAAIGWCGIRALEALRPESLARFGAIGLSPEVLLFVVAISLLSAILCGIAPALQANRVDLTDMLREGGARTSARSAMRGGMVIAEVTLGFVLLTGAGLMILSFHRVEQSSPGFDPAHVLSFEMQPRGYGNQESISFVRECERRIRELPGVRQVGAISHLPLDNYPNWYSAYRPEGMTEQEAKGLLADHFAVTSNYFRAMSAHLVDGRMFNDQDRADTQFVVIVDDALARATWPGQEAVGRRLTVERFGENGFAPAMAVVVGVVKHQQYHSLTDAGRVQVYIPYTQSPREHLSFVVRTGGDPVALAGPIRTTLRALNRDMAIAKVLPMTAYVRRAAAPVSFNAVLAAVFAGLGLLLTAVGVYSVISCAVSQRTKEFGVRMAIGARPADILRLVMREGLTLVVAGVAAGAAFALLLARYLQALLFGVAATDAGVYACAAAVVAVAALVACWRPASRAARGSVCEALRVE